jgi:hypothetical protein
MFLRKFKEYMLPEIMSMDNLSISPKDLAISGLLIYQSTHFAFSRNPQKSLLALSKRFFAASTPPWFDPALNLSFEILAVPVPELADEEALYCDTLL